MKDQISLRERYLQESLPSRLGELAANLARIKSSSSNLLHEALVKHLIEESQLYIQWTIGDTEAETAFVLRSLQGQLSQWQQNWSVIWVDALQRMERAEQANVWSERILELSGLLSESTISA
ncbi:MAG: hypothetical protein KME42_17975 [Tildeniella nuda ZEHNDER 1965/U140]|jgi:hypothetical protein|nr:hypothetical protein [Tildeniella nuda ZEHNDER 1965/U140]